MTLVVGKVAESFRGQYLTSLLRHDIPKLDHFGTFVIDLLEYYATLRIEEIVGMDVVGEHCSVSDNIDAFWCVVAAREKSKQATSAVSSDSDNPCATCPVPFAQRIRLIDLRSYLESAASRDVYGEERHASDLGHFEYMDRRAAEEEVEARFWRETEAERQQLEQEDRRIRKEWKEDQRRIRPLALPGQTAQFARLKAKRKVKTQEMGAVQHRMSLIPKHLRTKLKAQPRELQAEVSELDSQRRAVKSRSELDRQQEELKFEQQRQSDQMAKNRELRQRWEQADDLRVGGTM